MKLPRVHGVIRRRLLMNFRLDPEVAQAQLPEPFRPKTHNGYAVAGICLIRLEDIRPRHVPRMLGISSENAAHRFAVTWTDGDGGHEGVYIPRRDSDSLLNQVAGGRIFPGEHHAAQFTVDDHHDRVSLRMASRDGSVTVSVDAALAAELPGDSMFRSIDEASAFFEPGSLGYSATADGEKLDGILLRTKSWNVQPLRVESVVSSYFADELLFPAGSIHFDCGLVMREIEHEWSSAADLYI